MKEYVFVLQINFVYSIIDAMRMILWRNRRWKPMISGLDGDGAVYSYTMDFGLNSEGKGSPM